MVKISLLAQHRLFRFLVVFSLFLNYVSPVLAQPSYWPTAGWKQSSPEEQGMDPALLIEMLNHIIQDGVDIDSISIVRNGYLVADIYMYPADKSQKHPIHSCTKSIASTLIGIAIDKGFIKGVEEPVIRFFPDRTINHLDEQKKAITLKNLLSMSSGLDTKDNLMHHGWHGLYKMKETDDWTQYVLDRPMADHPGTRFEYSNLGSFLLTSILQKKTQTDALNFAKTHLFNPLGIEDILWYKSPKGIYTGYAELWLRPHDMAKIGYLYLNNGSWEGQQLLSAEWIQEATTPQIPAGPFFHYGYQWWVSEGFYFAMGYQGQFIFVIPEEQMVVVFTSTINGQSIFTPYHYLKKYILPACRSTNPLDVDPKISQRFKHLTNELKNTYYHEIAIER